MPAQRVKQYLDENNVKYVVLSHSLAYTSQEIAVNVHISGKKMAKTVIVKMDGKMAMAVVPAHESVNLERLKIITGAHQVTLATEEEFKEKFPGCETGAMPPLGHLYGMDVYASEDLSKNGIAFNAGNLREIIQMSYADFERLVKPKVSVFSGVAKG